MEQSRSMLPSSAWRTSRLGTLQASAITLWVVIWPLTSDHELPKAGPHGVDQLYEVPVRDVAGPHHPREPAEVLLHGTPVLCGGARWSEREGKAADEQRPDVGSVREDAPHDVAAAQAAAR